MRHLLKVGEMEQNRKNFISVSVFGLFHMVRILIFFFHITNTVYFMTINDHALLLVEIVGWQKFQTKTLEVWGGR